MKNLLILTLLLISTQQMCQSTPKEETIIFKPSIESLREYQCPEWYMDAKLGMWMHFGPASLSRKGGWHPRHLFNPESSNYKQHLEQHGHLTTYGWHDVVKEWNPSWYTQNNIDELVGLMKKAGARYICALGGHHDNILNWKSDLCSVDSYDLVGKDIVSMIEHSTREVHNLRFGVSTHLDIWWLWMQGIYDSDPTGPYKNIPYVTEDHPQVGIGKLYPEKMSAKPETTYYHEFKWNKRDLVPQPYRDYWEGLHYELLDTYKPDLLYFDGNLPFNDKTDNSPGNKILAHFYNQSQIWNNGKLDAVMNMKHDDGSFYVKDLERAVLTDIIDKYWQTDTSIGPWYYTSSNYKSADRIIGNLIDIVSKNGNLMLNIPPRPDGSLDDEALKILHEMAEWMNTNNESVFATRHWDVYGEGPTLVSNKRYGDEVDFTSQDIRFTRNKSNTILYTTILDWPGDGATVTVKSLSKDYFNMANIESIKMLGVVGLLKWKQDTKGLHVTLPEQAPCKYAQVLKLSFAKHIPAYNGPRPTKRMQQKSKTKSSESHKTDVIIDEG